MRRFRGYQILISFVAMAGLLFAFALAGCDEDEPNNTGGKKDAGGNTKQDVGNTQQDVGNTQQDKGADQPIWPDIWGPEQGTDLFPHPEQGYKPSPFGCTADADCFGQKCCATPWGVKLCAPSCDIKP